MNQSQPLSNLEAVVLRAAYSGRITPFSLHLAVYALREERKTRTNTGGSCQMKPHKDFEQARLLLEAVKNPIPLQVTRFFEISWIPAPEGSSCPRCKGALERSMMRLFGPYSGTVRCTACDYHDSLMSYLGKSMIQVQPMPPGAALIYTEEPEESD